MKIAGIEVYRRDLTVDAETANGAPGDESRVEQVYVVLRADNSMVGFGEAHGDLACGEAERSGDAVAQQVLGLAGEWAGRHVDDWAVVIDGLREGSASAKSALDMAVHDLVAKAYGVAVYELLGGAVNRELMSTQLIDGDATLAAQRAGEQVASGVRFLKVQVGRRSWTEDCDRIQAVREAVGSSISLAVDARMSWDAREAVRIVRRLGAFDVAYVERPCADLAGLKYVRDLVDVPIMADESVRSVSDTVLIARARAADLLHLNLERLGGIRNWFRAAAIAETAGLDIMLGQGPGGGLSMAAAVHCAKAARAKYFEFRAIRDDASVGFRLAQGLAMVDDRPGLGASLQETALRGCRLVGSVRA